MSPLRMLCVFGTRPEAIKMAPVVLAAQRHAKVKPIVCLTGQHREMLDQVVKYFALPVDRDLNLMQPNQTLSDLTSRCLQMLSVTIAEIRPDCVVGQGDTTTALCASVAAFYARIPFVHVEAGLRTDSIDSPFPGRIQSPGLFPDDRSALRADGDGTPELLREGYAADDVIVTGNTVLDALRFSVQQERLNSFMWVQKYPDIAGRPMVLITAHRRENHGDGIRNLCTAIARLADMFPKVQFVYPVHLNPNIRGPVHEILSDRRNVHLIPPADYPEFIWLMDQSTLILSDSGGVQEEAPSLRKPVLVTRNSTERPEALAVGATKLIGTDPDRVVAEVCELLTNRDAYAAMQVDVNPYGDGRAAERVVDLAFQRFAAVSERARAGGVLLRNS